MFSPSVVILAKIHFRSVGAGVLISSHRVLSCSIPFVSLDSEWSCKLRRMVMLAIDFGTSRTKVAYLHNGKPELMRFEGEVFMPSTFYVDEDGDIRFGKSAERMRERDPDGFSEEPLKVLLKKRKNKVIRLKGKRSKYPPQVFLEKLFQLIKEIAEDGLSHIFDGKAIEHVVLTHPASYIESEKTILRAAAAAVGWSVTFISEPEAAALAWQQEIGQTQNYDKVVILDCGGGTIDWACLHNDKGVLRSFTEIEYNANENIGGKEI